MEYATPLKYDDSFQIDGRFYLLQLNQKNNILYIYIFIYIYIMYVNI